MGEKIPSTWTWVRLAQVANPRGVTVNPQSSPEIAFRYIELDDIEKDTGKIGYIEDTLGKDIGSTKLVFEAGDILYGKLRPYLKKFTIAPFSGVSVTDLIPLKCSQAIFNKYLLNFFFSTFHSHHIAPLMSGINLPRLRSEDIKNIPLPLPPLNEQRRIADRIDALQARSRRAREALTEAQTLLEQFRQSVLSAAFSGGLTAKWREEHPDVEPASELLKCIRIERRTRWEKVELAKYAAKGKTPPPGWQKKYLEPVQVDTTDLPELPPGWCWASLDEIASNVQYGTSEKTTDAGDIPVLRMGNIVNGQLFFDNLKYLPANMVSDEMYLDDGDILFNRTNSIELVGKSAVFRGTDKTTFASYLIRVSVISVPPELVSEYINSPFGRSWVLSVANQQVGQANVNGTKLKALAIPLPSEEEQKYIAHIFSKTRLYSDRIAQTADMSLAQCASLDQSILAKAFRGELVPQDPNDEPAAKLLERIRNERQSSEPARAPRGRKKATP